MYAGTRYFARSYFGGVWPSLIEEGELTIRPSSFAQSVLFGSPRLDFEILPTGFSHSTNFGTPKLDFELFLQGIAQDSEFGTPRIDLGILPSGIGQTVEFGIPGIDLNILSIGINQQTALGSPSIELEIRPINIEQYVEFGVPEIEISGLFIHPPGIGQHVDFGTPRIRLEINILPEGIRQYVEFGIPRLRLPAKTIDVRARLIPTDEITQIRTRAAVSPIQFRSLIEQANNILASSTEGNEMAKAIKVTVKQDSAGQLVSTNPITVESLLTAGTAGRLDTLGDVDATEEVEGGVPVYDPATDKYVVEKLNILQIEGSQATANVDGGTF